MKQISKASHLVRRTARMVPTAAVLMSLVFVAACARTVKKASRPSEQKIQMSAASMISQAFGHADFYNEADMKFAAKFQGATLSMPSSVEGEGSRSVNVEMMIVMKDVDTTVIHATGLATRAQVTSLPTDAPPQYSVRARCHDAMCMNVLAEISENETKVENAQINLAAPEAQAALPADASAPAVSADAEVQIAQAPLTEPVHIVKQVGKMYVWFKTDNIKTDSKKTETAAERVVRINNFDLVWSSPTVEGGTTGSIESAEKMLSPLAQAPAQTATPASGETAEGQSNEVIVVAPTPVELQPLNVRVPTLVAPATEGAAAAPTASPTPAAAATPAVAAAPAAATGLFF